MSAKTLIYHLSLSTEKVKLAAQRLYFREKVTVLDCFRSIQNTLKDAVSDGKLPSRSLQVNALGLSKDQQVMKCLVEVCTELNSQSVQERLSDILGDLAKEIIPTGDFSFDDVVNLTKKPKLNYYQVRAIQIEYKKVDCYVQAEDPIDASALVDMGKSEFIIPLCDIKKNTDINEVLDVTQISEEQFETKKKDKQ